MKRTVEELTADVEAKWATAKAAADAFVEAKSKADAAARARDVAMRDHEQAWAELLAKVAGLPLVWAFRRVRHWDDVGNDFVPILIRHIGRGSLRAVWIHVHFPDRPTEVEFVRRRNGVWRHYINPGSMGVPWLDISADDVTAAGKVLDGVEP